MGASLNRERLRGRWTVWGRSGEARKVLYMVTVAVVRVNPAIRAFYRRLPAGKAKKPALVAYMRKLLVILNAMLKHGTPRSPYPTRP